MEIYRVYTHNKGSLAPVTNKGLQLFKLTICECGPRSQAAGGDHKMGYLYSNLYSQLQLSASDGWHYTSLDF